MIFVKYLLILVKGKKCFRKYFEGMSMWLVKIDQLNKLLNGFFKKK